MGEEQKDDEQMDEQEENFYDDEEELMVYTQKDYDDAEELMTQNEAKETRDYELARQWERQHPEVDEKGNSPSQITFCPLGEKENPGSSSSSIPKLVEQMEARSASERRAIAERSEMGEERKQGVEAMKDPTCGGIYLLNSPGGEDASRRHAEQIARPGRQEGKYMDRSKGPAIAMGRSKGKYLDRSERKAKTPTLVPAAENDEVRAAAEAAAVKAYIRAVSKYHRRLCQCGNEAATGCDKCGRCCPGCERHGRKVESSESSESEEEEEKPWRGASEEAK